MNRHTSLFVAACLTVAALVRAVSGQEPTPAPPRTEASGPPAYVAPYGEIRPTAGEVSQGPVFNFGETPVPGPAGNASAGSGSGASGISGYPSVSYPSTAFPSQVPPPEPKGPPPVDDKPPGLLDSFNSLYHDGIEPMIDGAGEWLGEYWGEASPVCDRKWAIHGWLNPGYSWNPDNPANRLNTPVAFNDRSNELMLNQAYTYLERRVKVDGCSWDFGARADVIYGTDRRFMQATGLELQQNNSPKWNSDTYYGVALPQVYAEIAAPVANGATLKIGHFYSIFGFERLMAPDNFFYSHSYARVYGMPATHTGGLLTVYLPPNRFFSKDNITLITGITQGWDTWGHQNKDLSWLAGFMADVDDLGITLSGAFMAGQEPVANTGVSVPFGTGPFLTQDRWSWNLILSKQFTEKLGYVAETVGGSQAAGTSTTTNGVTTTSPALWYGLTNYLIYEINDSWASALRFEWFEDQEYYRVQRTPTAVAGGFPFNGHNYFALTMGLNWRPRKNIIVRPELRWDWSDVRGNSGVTSPLNRVYDDGTSGSQFLWATDVIYSF